MANVANAIKDGPGLMQQRDFIILKFLQELNNQKQIQIVFYNGALILPEDVAYGASGMKVPEAPKSK